MNIVIQNSTTKLYLGEDGNWSSAHGAAKRFSSSYEAFAHCRHHGMPDCTVILSCDPCDSVASPTALANFPEPSFAGAASFRS
jgi:hypothetical protein